MTRAPGDAATPASGEQIEVARLFQAAHYDWNDPLSAQAFSAWRDPLSHKQDAVVTGTEFVRYQDHHHG